MYSDSDDPQYDLLTIDCRDDSCTPCFDPTYEREYPLDVICCKGDRGPPGPPGPRGSDCYCESQFAYLSSVYPYPSTSTVTYVLPSLGTNSYVNVTFTDPDCPLTLATYPGWCFDLFDTIFLGQTYVGVAVPILDSASAFTDFYVCNPNHPIFTANLPAVLYVLNLVNTYLSRGYSVSDIQSVIWTLLFAPNPLTDTPLAGDPIGNANAPVTPRAGNVRIIIAEALSAQTAYNATGTLQLIAPNCIDVLLLFTRNEAGCVQIVGVTIEMCTLIRCTQTTSLYLSTSADVTIDAAPAAPPLPLDAVASIPGTNVFFTTVDSLLWPSVTGTTFTVPTSGRYNILVRGSFLYDLGFSSAVSIGMSVNGVLNTRSVTTCSLSTMNLIGETVSNFFVDLSAGDLLSFYAVTAPSDLPSVILGNNTSVTGFSTDLTPWYSVTITKL